MYDALTSTETQRQSVSIQELGTTDKTGLGSALGMSTFSVTDQQAFGRSLRVAMALVQGKATDIPVPGKAMPDDAKDIVKRLKTLNGDITSSLADLVELLVRFDDLKGWQQNGAQHCAAWIDMELVSAANAVESTCASAAVYAHCLSLQRFFALVNLRGQKYAR